MAEYEKEFSCLSKYAPESVLTKKFRCRHFEEGLHESIKRYLTAVTSLQVVNFYQLVQAAIKIEKSELRVKKERKRKSSQEGVHLREKDLESHKLIQYRVKLQGVGDKDQP